MENIFNRLGAVITSDVRYLVAIRTRNTTKNGENEENAKLTMNRLKKKPSLARSR